MTRFAVIAVLLASSLACERNAPDEIFAPAEAGLTLAYEDPSLPGAQRVQERLQIRVAKVEQEGNRLLVTKTFTTLKGQMEVLFAYEDGGVSLMRDPKTTAFIVLPRRFPNVRSWEERGRRYRVEGRAAMPQTGLLLPETMNRVGVWVVSESLDGKGPNRRSFFLPKLGEIETQEFQEGKWVAVNRLFSYGFEDPPLSKKN